MSKIRRLESARSQSKGPQGKVIHDQRGNAVWDWAIATDVLAKSSSDELVRRLAEPGSLALAGEEPPVREWTGDPYNRRVSSQKR
jgi:hypothetical protein